MATKALPILFKATPTKHYLITLPPELHARLRQPVKGEGGWQNLLQDLQDHTDPVALEAEIPEALMHRMIPYAVKFGSGGYQGIIRWVLCLVLQQHEAGILGTSKTLAQQVGGVE